MPGVDGVEQRAYYTHRHCECVEQGPTIGYERPEPVHEKIEHELQNIKDREGVINGIKCVWRLPAHVRNFGLHNVYPKIDH